MIAKIRQHLARPGTGSQLLKAMVGSAGLRIIGMGFAFLVGVQLARGLGPAGYGIYGIVMAAIAVLMIPTELGLPQLVMREVSSALATEGECATHAVIGWGKRIVLLSSLVIAGGALFAYAAGLLSVGPEVGSALIVGLLWIPVVAIGNIYGAVLRGMKSIVSGQVGEFLARPALMSILLFIFVYVAGWQLTPTSAMALNVICAGVAVGLTIGLLRHRMRTIESADVKVPVNLKFAHALPMAMSEGMRVFGGQIGMLVLSVMASNEEAGLYRVAFGIYAVSTMPSALINVACAPTISTLFSEGKVRELARLNVWVSLFLTAAAAIFLLFSVLYGREAISIIFGGEFEEAIVVLLIFMAGEVVASMFGHPTVVLNMMRRQKVVMWWSAIALAVNFSLTLILVHHIGYEGAAIGSAGGLVIWRAGCSIYAKRSAGMDTSLITKVLTSRSVRLRRG